MGGDKGQEGGERGHVPRFGPETWRDVFDSEVGTEGGGGAFCSHFPWGLWKKPASQVASHPSGAHLIQVTMMAQWGRVAGGSVPMERRGRPS